MSKDAFTLRYLARAASGVPRDLAQTLVASRLGPIRPTVLIYNCTWVCDARCEMCNNWKHGDRKSDMTLAQLEPAMRHRLWRAIENLNTSGTAATICATTRDEATIFLPWARTKKPDIVFNMLRFTDAMLNNKELEEKIGFQKREEEFMRTFFLDRVQEESVLSGQAFLYLHYADMIANGYQRTMPCPFRTQGLLLNPYGDLHYCENSQAIGNVLTTPAEELYFKAENLGHRQHV